MIRYDMRQEIYLQWGEKSIIETNLEMTELMELSRIDFKITILNMFEDFKKYYIKEKKWNIWGEISTD